MNKRKYWMSQGRSSKPILRELDDESVKRLRRSGYLITPYDPVATQSSEGCPKCGAIVGHYRGCAVMSK